MRNIFLTFTIGLSFLSVANCVEKKIDLFSYEKLLSVQYHCNSKELLELNLDPKRDFQLATKAWSVIDKLQLSNRKSSRADDSKSYRLTYLGMGYLECGKEIQGLDSFCGESIVELPVVRHAWQRDQYADISGDEDPSTFRENLNFTANDISTDMPQEKGTRGLTCLVNLSDLLRNPKAINLDQLCEGHSKEDRAKTEKEIQKAIEIWKARKCVE